MRGYIIAILITVMLPLYSLAQIEDEIRAYVDSSEILVQQGRRLMLKELNDNNLVKTREIYDYLTDLTKDGPYAAFSYIEHLYINMLTNNWETVDRLMLNFDFVNQLVYPGPRDILQKTAMMISQNSQSIAMSCEKSDIEEQPKMLIMALLKYMESEKPGEEYNAIITAYKKKYPNNKYESFVKKFMPDKIMKAAWAISLGSGVVFPTGDLGLDFNENASINMSMDFNIHKVYASLYITGTNFKLQRPFYTVSDIDTVSYSLNEKFTYFEGGLKGGYFLVRSKHIQLAPYAAILGSSLESTKYSDPEDDDLEYEIFNSFAYGAGLHTEVKLYEFKSKNQYYGNPADGYLSIKVDAGYNKIAKFKDKTSMGDIPYVTIAFVIGFGTF